MCRIVFLSFVLVFFSLGNIAGCSLLVNDVESKTQNVAQRNSNRDCVVLLHGLGRTSASMNKLADVLRAEGYWVWNEGYSSRSAIVETLARTTTDRALAACRAESTGKIHFVTHSLGGILVRQYFQDLSVADPAIERLGKIVMLSPPNAGSEVIDKFKGNALFRWVVGPAGLQLGTDQNSVPQGLGPVAADIGIITGNVSSDPWFSPLIPGEDDGKVSVESARLAAAKDFLVLPYGHASIMKRAEVITQVRYFLKHARFQHSQQDESDDS